MFRKMMLALVLCGLTTSAFAQGAKHTEAKEAGKGKMEKKVTPARDAKGRFVKKDDGKMAAGKMAGGAGKMAGDKKERKLPPRDPKTGRFMKKEDAAKMGAGKMAGGAGKMAGDKKAAPKKP